MSGYNVGGAVVKAVGYQTNSAPFAWSHVKVRGFDVGQGLYHYYGNSNTFDVIVRRSHQNGAYIQNTGQMILNINSDETLLPNTPGATDGIGLLLIDTNWATVNGTVGLAKYEALKMLGNDQWNTINGEFYDSSTLTNGGTSNIVLNNNGGATTPQHNIFNVFAGWDASGSTNKPAYGLNQIAGSTNILAAFDASGVLNAPGYTGSNLQMGANWQGSNGSARYYNPSSGRTELHGLNALKYDIDTDTSAGGTPGFIISSRNGTTNLINAQLGAGTTFDTSVNAPKAVLSGTTSGTTTIQPAAAATGVLTLPAATDTLVGRATTDTLSNKTISSGTLSGTTTLGAITEANSSFTAGAGAAIVLKGGSATTYDLLVQNNAGTQNNLTVDDAGNAAAVGNMNIGSGKTYQVNGAQIACANLSNGGNGGCAMSTTAGGDLSGTLPMPTVVQVNGAGVPASANLVGTNGSKQLIAASAHMSSVPAQCSPASASGTAYACSTSPSFTPAAKDRIYFTADVANTGTAPTLAVNGAAAAPIKKLQGQAALAANDLRAGESVTMFYDGTNWVMDGQSGNALAATDLPVIVKSADQGLLWVPTYTAPQNVSTAAISSVANRVQVYQFVVPYAVTFTKMAFNLSATAAAGHCSFGVYNIAGTTLLASTGAIDTSSISGARTFTVSSTTLTPGPYWVAATCDNTTNTSPKIAVASSTLNVMNVQTNPKYGYAANASSAGVLPAMLGTITADAAVNPFVFEVEP